MEHGQKTHLKFNSYVTQVLKLFLSPMYRPSTGGMSSDTLRKAIISSSSSLFLIKGKYPPIDLHN